MTQEEELDWLYRLKSEIYVYMPREWLIPMDNALDAAIKSLEQEPKTGHWVYTGDYITEGMLKCSECGFEHDVSERFSFCPECGAKMVEVSESEE